MTNLNEERFKSRGVLFEKWCLSSTHFCIFPRIKNESVVLFFVFYEVMFTLNAALSSSVYVTIDTGASSAVKVELVAFSSFASAIFLCKL